MLPPRARLILHGLLIFAAFGTLAACSSPANVEHEENREFNDQDHQEPTSPDLSPVQLAPGEKLNVVATTNIVGDVVANIGGESINLTILMGAGQDPHTFEPTPRDLALLEEADVIYINGLGFEEGLLEPIEEQAAAGIPVVSVSTGILLLETGEDHEHGIYDPHVWMNPENVMIWADNIAAALSTLDPQNTNTYQANAADYIAQLQDLTAYIEQQVEQLPVEGRILVTDHDSLAYFADRFGFDIVGTVVPGATTAAEPSARDLAQLTETIREVQAPAIFVDASISSKTARTVADEVGYEVAVLTLYEGSVGPQGSGAETYVDMMRTNIDAIVGGLSP